MLPPPPEALPVVLVRVALSRRGSTNAPKNHKVEWFVQVACRLGGNFRHVAGRLGR
jgi:hypothetical protein